MLRRLKNFAGPVLSLFTVLTCVEGEIPLETIVSEQSVQLNQLQQQIAQLKQHLHSRGPGGQAAIDAAQLSQPPSTVNGIKLDIQYPGAGGGEGGGNGAAEGAPGFVAGPAPKKTPLIIIAPKPLMSFNKLYEKMLVESQQAGSEASQLLKGQADALDNPMERIKVLANASPMLLTSLAPCLQSCRLLVAARGRGCRERSVLQSRRRGNELRSKGEKERLYGRRREFLSRYDPLTPFVFFFLERNLPLTNLNMKLHFP